MADEEAVTSDEEDDAALTWKEKIVKLTTGTAPGKKMTANSPTARLKLLLVRPPFQISRTSWTDLLLLVIQNRSPASLSFTPSTSSRLSP